MRLVGATSMMTCLQFRLEQGAQGFRYLSESQSDAAPCFSLEDVDDGEALRTTLDAMQIVGIGKDTTLHQVSGFCHHGNV